MASASIKDVLSVLAPELSYKNLSVQGGTTAQRVWMQTVLSEMNHENKEEIMNDLRKYCERDTFAMVDLYRKLVECVNGNHD